MIRSRADRCPGVLRPWIADDGALVRLRLIGGRLPTESLRSLLAISAEHADGSVHLTTRTNLQLRGIAHADGCVPSALVDELTAAGLLPSPSHELVRNVMTSPLTGLAGGRADLRPVAAELDALLCADPALAGLAGRFLFVLDDGRGDVAGRSLDLGLVALDATTAQLRAGSHGWGPVVGLDEVAPALVAAARAFLEVRGAGETAAWHVDELPENAAPVLAPTPRHAATHVRSDPPPYGIIATDDGRFADHVAVPEGVLRPERAADVVARAGSEVVVTPWRSILVPEQETR